MDLQVEAPSQPSFLNDKERNRIVVRRIDEAAAQLPKSARQSSLVVVCGDRLWGVSGEPDAVIVHAVCSSTGYGHGLVLLRKQDFERSGQIATEVTAWNATLVAFAMFALSLIPFAPTRTA